LQRTGPTSNLQLNIILKIFHFELFQVIEIKDSVPAESYRVFMDILLDTIRNEIGKSLLKLYYY